MAAGATGRIKLLRRRNGEIGERSRSRPEACYQLSCPKLDEMACIPSLGDSDIRSRTL